MTPEPSIDLEFRATAAPTPAVRTRAASRRGGWRWPLSVAALTLLGCVVLGWTLRRPSSAAVPDVELAELAAPERAAAPVDAVRMRRADLSLRAEATGYLEPWRKVEIKSEAAGRVVERTVEEGSRVAAGGLLVRLDDRDRRIELEEAHAEWLKVQAGYAVNFSGLETPREAAPASTGVIVDEIRRAERLVAEGLLSRRELDELRRRHEVERVLSGAHQGEVRAATTGLAQAEQRLERSRLALERTRILAPFGGRVADLAVETGQQVAPGEALMTLLQDDRLKVDVDVLEADMVRLREGAPARVRIPSADDLVLDGVVATINPRTDPTTGTGRVTVAIPNPRGLLIAGLFASVELETERLPDRLVAPAGALLERQGRHLLFRIEDGKALWTYVEIGARSGDLVEITEGVSAGDLIAAGGHFALAHEAPVAVTLVGDPSDGR